MTWIFLAALCAAFALYLAVPFFLNGARETAPRLSTAAVRRASLDSQRRELGLDRDTGKIDDAEFARLKVELELEDSIAATREASRPAFAADETDLELEAEILIARARRRAASPPLFDAPTDAALEAEIARARTALQGDAPTEMPRVLAASNAASWTCSCGREMSSADRFCASCGARRAENLPA